MYCAVSSLRQRIQRIAGGNFSGITPRFDSSDKVSLNRYSPKKTIRNSRLPFSSILDKSSSSLRHGEVSRWASSMINATVSRTRRSCAQNPKTGRRRESSSCCGPPMPYALATQFEKIDAFILRVWNRHRRRPDPRALSTRRLPGWSFPYRDPPSRPGSHRREESRSPKRSGLPLCLAPSHRNLRVRTCLEGFIVQPEMSQIHDGLPPPVRKMTGCLSAPPAPSFPVWKQALLPEHFLDRVQHRVDGA